MSEARPGDSGAAPTASRWLIGGFLAMIGVSAAAFLALRPERSPPPPDIAKDAVLVAGREIYQARCVSCHGQTGRGDGPLAKGLAGPKPRDFSGEAWKYGDRPEQALAVVARGAPDTAMPGWAGAYSPTELRAVTAYVYYLAGKPVPASFRASP